jgi:hypothetical protein
MGVKAGEYVTQVKLTQDLVNGQRENVCWIEGRFARCGKLVRDENGETWVVSEVYGSTQVSDLHIQHRAWRDFSEVLG